MDIIEDALSRLMQRPDGAFFEEIGGGSQSVGLEVFQAYLGRDAREAALQTRRAFQRIYGLAAPDLELTEE